MKFAIVPVGAGRGRCGDPCCHSPELVWQRTVAMRPQHFVRGDCITHSQQATKMRSRPAQSAQACCSSTVMAVRGWRNSTLPSCDSKQQWLSLSRAAAALVLLMLRACCRRECSLAAACSACACGAHRRLQLRACNLEQHQQCYAQRDLDRPVKTIQTVSGVKFVYPSRRWQGRPAAGRSSTLVRSSGRHRYSPPALSKNRRPFNVARTAAGCSLQTDGAAKRDTSRP